MGTRLSDAYRELYNSVTQNEILNFDLANIEAEILSADEELSRDERLFEIRLSQLTSSPRNATSSCEALVSLRISALNLSILSSNLADAIESAVLASQDKQITPCDLREK